MPHKRYWQRVRINGRSYEVASDVTQQEQLEGTDPVSATVKISGTSAITEGDQVDICHVDHDTNTGKWQIGGSVDVVRSTGDPAERFVIVTDIMANRRRARTGDIDLSGLTDGEAVMLALDFAGIPYDPADIQDAGYVLGVHEPVTWLKWVTVTEIIDELDRPFQMRTMAVGGTSEDTPFRVVRFRYDLLPNGKTPVASFARGSLVDIMFTNEYTRGRRDAIRNVADCRGVSYECGDGCNCTPWAHADSTHPLIRGKAKPIDFQSDVVQDSATCVEIVQDLLHRFNRIERTVRVTAPNDQNVTVGKVIEVMDDMTIVGITVPTNFYVVSIDRQGNRMSMEGVGGAAGPVGTITSGVEQVCTDRDFDLPDTGSFAMPAVEFPPIVPDVPTIDIDTDECNGLPVLEDCAEAAFVPAFGIDATDDWELVGTLTLTDAADRLTIGVTTSIGDYSLTLAGEDYWDSIDKTARVYLIETPGMDASQSGSAPLDTAIEWVLRWEAANGRLVFYAEVESTCWFAYAFHLPAYSGAETFEDEDGTPTRADEFIRTDCGEGLAPIIPVPGDWTTEFGSVTYPTDGALSMAANPDAQASYDDTGSVFPLTSATRFRWTGHCSRAGTDHVFVGFYLASADDTVGAEIEWHFSSTGGEINFYEFPTGFVGDFVVDLPAVFDFAMDWNPGAGTLSLEVDGVPHGSYSLGTWPGVDLYPKVWHGTAVSMAMNLTDMEFTIGG